MGDGESPSKLAWHARRLLAHHRHPDKPACPACLPVLRAVTRSLPAGRLQQFPPTCMKRPSYFFRIVFFVER